MAGCHDLIARAFHISTDTDRTQCANHISAHHPPHWFPIRGLIVLSRGKQPSDLSSRASHFTADQSPNRHKFKPNPARLVITISPSTTQVVKRLHLDNSIGRLASPSVVHGLQRGCSSRAETTSCRVRCNIEPHNAAWLPL